ncbi:hypothetical protein [Pelagibius sp. Alg239-R121]|uniref:hypothetical protein n=1 Tax=Pelagibius sp. Alg239-R121 TaxID=2993448 RepID=UPI0024A6D922|nr:hypothetical protein [Pelagibius sp. Alg239-R121]
MIWNLFTQLLFPLIMILSLVAVLEISKNKLVGQYIEAENKDLKDQIEGIGETKPEQARILEWRNIYELQRLRMLEAWNAVKIEERARIGFAIFSSGFRVRLNNTVIDDLEFQVFSSQIKSLFDGKAASRQSYLDGLYARVLEKANLVEARAGFQKEPVQKWADELTVIEDVQFGELSSDQKAQLALAKAKIVVPTNRALIHNAILEGVDTFEQDAKRIQSEVLTRILDLLLARPAELDAKSKQLVNKILDQTTTPEDRRAKVNEFYKRQIDQIRERLQQAGYAFLDVTWYQLQSVE